MALGVKGKDGMRTWLLENTHGLATGVLFDRVVVLYYWFIPFFLKCIEHSLGRYSKIRDLQRASFESES